MAPDTTDCATSRHPPWGNLQRHLAWCAVGPTTLRRMVAPGGRRAVCAWMSQVNLADLTAEPFPALLEQWTASLQSNLGFAFGPARKSLNLFLRDLSHNHWMRVRLSLDAIEAQLEVPLDGKVMVQLRERRPGTLPNVSVINLTPSISERYQVAATEVAAQMRMLRVHLDVEWWSES